MGRFSVSENIWIEVFRGIHGSSENQSVISYNHKNSRHQNSSNSASETASETALYREQFHSTSFVMGERNGNLELVFRLHPSSFLFDLEGQLYQIHVLFHPNYFLKKGLAIESESHIPQNLTKNFYQSLFVSCELQVSLNQLVQIELADLNDAFEPMDFKLRLQLESIAIRLLMDCMEVSERTIPSCEACRFLEKSDNSAKIFEAMNYIQNNFKINITIPQIAKEVGINQCYLKKGFKELYGKTIYGMVQSLRMELASELLKNSANSMLEIALEVGYNNAASFSTAYKQYFGYSPQQSRHNNS